jgi:hypothetical protein
MKISRELWDRTHTMGTKTPVLASAFLLVGDGGALLKGKYGGLVVTGIGSGS